MGSRGRAAVYHNGPFLGRREAFARFPWLHQAAWDALADRFPVRIPRAYVGAASDRDDVRLRTALPASEELLADDGDLPDPVGDAAMSPVPWVVRKHADRVLLLLTKRCHVYCRFCFRRNHRPGEAEDPSPEEWAAMLAYAAGSGAREVILSGGDPLAIPDRKLFSAMDALGAIPVRRVHTRAPVVHPERVTDALIAGLRTRSPVWMVVHANHPDELTGPVRAALGRLVDAGIPVLNQSVLLAGINDDPDVLARLCEQLVALRVFPYYLHHPDRAAGNAHFRVSLARGRRIHRALARRVSGIALPAYVLDAPDGSGKAPVR